MKEVAKHRWTSLTATLIRSSDGGYNDNEVRGRCSRCRCGCVCVYVCVGLTVHSVLRISKYACVDTRCN